MNISISKASKIDLPQVLGLVQELATYEKMPDAVTAVIEDYEAAMEENRIYVLKAENEGKMVGMALYYLTFSTWKGKMMYLEDFYVQEEYRKFGIGKMIFDALLEDCAAKNCILLKWQVLDWNIPAIKFYEKIGATIEKEWWNGKIYLQKDLEI